MPSDPLDHSFHDAWVEEVTFGPRREVLIRLHLASARLTDPRLPEEAALRFGAVANFEDVQPALQLGPEPICRIDQITFACGESGAVHSVRLELDPQGVVHLRCDKVALTPIGRAE